MTLNSATLLDKTDRLYSDSSADDALIWNQIPTDRQLFEHNNKVVDGIYMQVKPFQVVLPDVNEMILEFTAWEAASDEDFLKFEKENL